ncbi:hypothetical protein HDE68_004330 [Pedobacter cryoconitis]|uniref:Uncharacterized protein n=1 Tax=Pedobacter cryoconitis TaxID=188932 RepID=A0A7W8ZQM0_9SPHI|nr:hypothetical protein [Pedobacter cryoconitis]
MQISTYVVYELISRLQELNPIVGEYLNYKSTMNGILILTSAVQIAMPDDILLQQFNDPASITQNTLLEFE